MDVDLELEAMGTIASALEELDGEAKSRVLRWVLDRCSVRLDASDDPAASKANGVRDSAPAPQGRFPEVADLFASAAPKTDKEKALVLAYWFQVAKGATNFESLEINRELKQLGYGLSNVTATLTDLIEAKPSLVMQVQKSGKAQQARKKYRLTNEGIKRVNDMLGSASGESTHIE
jgi:hypothetical protein